MVEWEPVPSVLNCVHHWVIESPAGLQSPGVCKICNVSRLFSNSDKDKKITGIFNTGFLGSIKQLRNEDGKLSDEL